MEVYLFCHISGFPPSDFFVVALRNKFTLLYKAIIYYFTQQNKSATAVIVVVVTNILI